MPGINQFPAFATGVSANVLSPASWSALATLLANGFQTGVADSAQVNTAVRQAVFGTAALAKIISDNEADALDNGDLAQFVTRLKTALTAATVGDAVQHSEFTGTNQSLGGASGFQKIPGGLILQYGLVVNAGVVSGTPVTFPIAFPTACFGLNTTYYTGTLSTKSGNDNNDTYANLTRFGFDIENEGTLATHIFYLALGN